MIGVMCARFRLKCLMSGQPVGRDAATRGRLSSGMLNRLYVGVATITTVALLQAAPCSASTGAGREGSSAKFETHVAGLTVLPLIRGRWKEFPRGERLIVNGDSLPGMKSKGKATAKYFGPIDADTWCVAREFAFESMQGESIGSLKFVLVERLRSGRKRVVGSIFDQYPAVSAGMHFKGGVRVPFLGVGDLSAGESMELRVRMFVEGAVTNFSERLEFSSQCTSSTSESS